MFLSRIRHSKAFTMIEVLLVITVLALLAGMGVMALRHQAQRDIAAKTALEMQGVLQAAMAYNVDHQTWPVPSSCDPSDFDTCKTAAISCSVNSAQASGDFVQDYLPNEKTTTSTGQTICWSTATDSSGNPAELNTNRFWVEMKVPGTGAQRLLMARRIAAKLPSAVVTSTLYNTTPLAECADDSDACYVRTEVSQPGPVSNEEAGTHIVGTGSCNPIVNPINPEGNTPCYQGTDLEQTGSDASLVCKYNASETSNFVYHIEFNCPAGQVGYVHASTSHLYAGYVGRFGELTPLIQRLYVADQTSTPQPCAAVAGSENRFACALTVVAEAINGNNLEPYSIKNNSLTATQTVSAAPRHLVIKDQIVPTVQDGCVGLNYIVYCKKPSTSSVAKDLY